MKLNASRIPLEFHQWIPLAERWGIVDDGYRLDALQSASAADLAYLQSFRSANEDILDECLAGHDSYHSAPSAEYLAFSALRRALEEAPNRLNA